VATLALRAREDALRGAAGRWRISELIAALGRNPLPDAFVLSTDAPRWTRLPPTWRSSREWPRAGGCRLARRLAALAAIARFGLWLLAGLLGTGLVAVTFNTIRLQILTQRDEIEVSKAESARPNRCVHSPAFYYLGLLQGLAGGAVAIGTLRPRWRCSTAR